MEIIYADENGIEQGIWTDPFELDMEIGAKKDFEMKVKLSSRNAALLDFQKRIYIPGTEWGGIVRCRETNSRTGELIVTGPTWRELLTNKAIGQHDDGQYTVSGELNDCLRELIEVEFPGLFFVPKIDTGVKVNYKFENYPDLLSGLESMLFKVGYRLDIKSVSGEANKPGSVQIRAVPIKKYEEEFSQDGRIDFKSKENKNGCNHLICLGSDKVTPRPAVHLFADEYGEIKILPIQYYFGISEKIEIFEAGAEEDLTELEQRGREHFQKLLNYKEFEMLVENVELEIGDIASGRDNITGTYISRPLISKILTMDNKSHKIEYKMKGEDD